MGNVRNKLRAGYALFLFGIAAITIGTGNALYKLADKFCKFMLSDKVDGILRVTIYVCLILILSPTVIILAPLVIYTIFEEYYKYGEFLSWRAS